MSEEISNLRAAIDKTVASGEMSVSTEVSSEGTADKQILIRIPERDRERWKMAAEKKGKTVSQFIREVVDLEVEGILDCRHPVNQRRYYPWAEFCLECGQRLRG
jgi:predicted DNA-binding protein